MAVILAHFLEGKRPGHGRIPRGRLLVSEEGRSSSNRGSRVSDFANGV
jgi:hypothetical protein